jgi:NAD(P)-dependent dehydrogenase (short-subunit alcohol dehydrogenase family)
MSLEGRTALITGAARGIGLAIAERLVSDGAKVALADRGDVLKDGPARLTLLEGGRYRGAAMPRDPGADPLMKKLLRAIEVSLNATDAARDAVQEILRRGADTGIFFSRSRSRGSPSTEMTPQDREFLRAVSIKPDR